MTAYDSAPTATMWQTVLQSQAIHPYWTAADHVRYLDNDDLTADTTALTGGTSEQGIGRWLAENISSGRLELVWRNAGIPARPCGAHHPAAVACPACEAVIASAGEHGTTWHILHPEER